MPYVDAETMRSLVSAADHLRGALDGTGRASEHIMERLDDDRVRLWMETWVMPPLDRLPGTRAMMSKPEHEEE